MARHTDTTLRHKDRTLRHQLRPRWHYGRFFDLETDVLELQTGDALILQDDSSIVIQSFYQRIPTL